MVRDRARGMTTSARERGRLGGYGLKIIEKVADGLTIRSTGDAGIEVEMVFANRAASQALSRS